MNFLPTVDKFLSVAPISTKLSFATALSGEEKAIVLIAYYTRSFYKNPHKPQKLRINQEQFIFRRGSRAMTNVTRMELSN